MSDTAEEIVTAAFRLIGALDIAEERPSAAEMTNGLRVLGRMIDSWQASSLNIVTRSLTANFSSGSTTVTDLSSTAQLAPGLNVSGTGIADGTRVASIDSTTQITLDTATTVQGSGTTLTFTALPFESKYEKGVIALLAMDLAPQLGIYNIPLTVQNMASDGWANLTANFMQTGTIIYDKDLLYTSIRRDAGVTIGNG